MMVLAVPTAASVFDPAPSATLPAKAACVPAPNAIAWMPLDVALVPSATPSARFTVAFWPIAVPPGAVCCTIAPLPMPMPLSPFTVVLGPMATDSAPIAAESVAAELAWKYLIGVTENELIAPFNWRNVTAS